MSISLATASNLLPSLIPSLPFPPVLNLIYWGSSRCLPSFPPSQCSWGVRRCWQVLGEGKKIVENAVFLWMQIRLHFDDSLMSFGALHWYRECLLLSLGRPQRITFFLILLLWVYEHKTLLAVLGVEGELERGEGKILSQHSLSTAGLKSNEDFLGLQQWQNSEDAAVLPRDVPFRDIWTSCCAPPRVMV